MQGIITKYHGPTASGPARISATSTAGTRKYYPAGRYDSDAENHQEAARAFVRAMNWHGIWYSGAYNDKGALIWVCAAYPRRPHTSFTVAL